LATGLLYAEGKRQVEETFLVSSMALEDFVEVSCPWYFPEMCVVMSLSLFFADFAS